MPVMTERLERLIRTSNTLAAGLPLDQVLQWIADTARELLDARYAAIGLLGPDGRTLESFTTSGLDEEARRRIGALPVGRGILGLVIREGHPIRLGDLMAHPTAAGFPPQHPPMHTFLGVPVGRHGALGNLYLTEKRGGEEFTEEDEFLAILLADKAATAVEDARTFAEISRLAAEVQELLRTRERFFAMVNHELRNSLAGVLGWAELMVRKKDPATVPRAAFEVLEAAESAASLINDLLDLSRLDEDRLKPVIQLVDCGAVLRRAVARVTPTADTKAVRITVTHRADQITCHTDTHRMEQILVNLLSNAIRHTPDASTVQLAAECTADQVLIRVADEGPGIPEADLERVFDVYFVKTGGDGRSVGLGLPLSRRLARLLGGDLTAANRAPGGAMLTLRIPLRRPMAPEV